MAIQMIFCVETNKKADTDSIYLMDAIRHLYITQTSHTSWCAEP